MNRRQLGRSGLDLSAVGFGAWAIGGAGSIYGWGPQDDDVSVATIRRAVDAGVNWIDTAPLYGAGHSEQVVGRALREIPVASRPLVFTKCGNVLDPAKPFEPPVRDLSIASIRREVEASLRFLGIEAIDLYQFHWPDETGVPVEESWGELGRLIDEGKIRHAGVCNFDIALLERCEALHHVASLQVPFSAVRREVAVELIPWAKRHGTGVIVYGPMLHGLLTDDFGIERLAAMAPDDWRRKNRFFNEPELSRVLVFRDALRPIAARHGVNVAAVAIAWELAWPGVTGAIAGARSPQQVDGLAAGGTLDLSTEDRDEIGAALRESGAGSGPMLAS